MADELLPCLERSKPALSLTVQPFLFRPTIPRRGYESIQSILSRLIPFRIVTLTHSKRVPKHTSDLFHRNAVLEHPNSERIPEPVRDHVLILQIDSSGLEQITQGRLVHSDHGSLTPIDST